VGRLEKPKAPTRSFQSRIARRSSFSFGRDFPSVAARNFPNRRRKLRGPREEETAPETQLRRPEEEGSAG
jgi:hypothetical protein